jgi:hypothetical protein
MESQYCNHIQFTSGRKQGCTSHEPPQHARAHPARGTLHGLDASTDVRKIYTLAGVCHDMNAFFPAHVSSVADNKSRAAHHAPWCDCEHLQIRS